MTARRYDIVGVGQCCIDHLGKIDAFPDADTKCEFSDLTVQCGGPVATALVALSRWGFTCSLSGIVGADIFGDEIRQTLHTDSVDTTHLLTRPNSGSQFAFVAVQPGVAHRTIFWRRATGAPLHPNELNAPAIQQARLIHVDGLHAEASLAACKIARDAGVPTMVDAGTLREGMLELVPFTDYFIASEGFAHALVARHDPEAACRELIQRGARIAGVTLGADGYLIQSGDRQIRGPAFPADAIDTTGCGDIFHAGVAYGVLSEWDLERTLRFAAWAAAQVSLHLGGRTGIPNAEDFPNQN